MARRCEPVVAISEKRKELSCRSSTRDAGELPNVRIACVEEESVLGFGRLWLLGMWTLSEAADVRLKIVPMMHKAESSTIIRRLIEPRAV